MRRSVPSRFAAFVVALFLALAGPGAAVAHGLAHDHLRREHAAHRDHDAARTPGHDGDAARGPSVAAPDDDHAHGHPAVDVAPGARAVDRVHLSAAVLATAPASCPAASDRPLAHAPALADHALLARSDPATGPPPRLRAPPIG